MIFFCKSLQKSGFYPRYRCRVCRRMRKHRYKQCSFGLIDHRKKDPDQSRIQKLDKIKVDKPEDEPGYNDRHSHPATAF